MTTAQKVIENLGWDDEDSEAIINALLSAPESVRLELAGRLCPPSHIVTPTDKTLQTWLDAKPLPAPPSEDKP